MKIIGIDTSCDETGIAILEEKKERVNILSNIISSQVKIHQKYGGVYPTLAKREHQRNLVIVLQRALKKANLLKKREKKKVLSKEEEEKLKKIFKKESILFKRTKRFLENFQKPKIDYLAVTIGPGLEPCLWAGVNFTRALSFFWQKKIVPVNHLEAHIFSAFLSENIPLSQIKKFFPAISLIVSGGHTQLVLVKSVGKYKLLGETRDDAAGECFDKVAKALGLNYPGGPEIERKAREFKKKKFNISLPRPLFFSQDYDFSFSGLKTAVVYQIKKDKKYLLKERSLYQREMAKEVQEIVVDVLLKKTIRAAKEYKVKTIILGGGVVANDYLRRRFKELVKREKEYNFFLLVPQKKFCTDNGAMVAFAGILRKDNSKGWENKKAKANLRL